MRFKIRLRAGNLVPNHEAALAGLEFGLYAAEGEDFSILVLLDEYGLALLLGRITCL